MKWYEYSTNALLYKLQSYFEISYNFLYHL
jgi:hypothetical protein